MLTNLLPAPRAEHHHENPPPLTHADCLPIWHHPPPGWRHPDLLVVWLTRNDPAGLEDYLTVKYADLLEEATS